MVRFVRFLSGFLSFALFAKNRKCFDKNATCSLHVVSGLDFFVEKSKMTDFFHNSRVGISIFSNSEKYVLISLELSSARNI